MSSPAVTRAPRHTRTPAPPPIAPWFPLVLAVAVAAATLLLLGHPSAPVQPEVAVSDGDQSQVFPQPEPGLLATLLGVNAIGAVLVGPLLAMLTAVWAGTWAWLSWEQLRSRDRAFLLVATVVAVGVVAFDFSPVGRAIARGVIG